MRSQITSLLILLSHSTPFLPNSCIRLKDSSSWSTILNWNNLLVNRDNGFKSYHDEWIYSCAVLTSEASQFPRMALTQYSRKFCEKLNSINFVSISIAEISNLGKLFFKYLNVFVSVNRCFSGKLSGSFIRQRNEQISLPPIEIVTIFQSNLKLTLLSFLIRCTNAFA